MPKDGASSRTSGAGCGPAAAPWQRAVLQGPETVEDVLVLAGSGAAPRGCLCCLSGLLWPRGPWLVEPAKRGPWFRGAGRAVVCTLEPVSRVAAGEGSLAGVRPGGGSGRVQRGSCGGGGPPPEWTAVDFGFVELPSEGPSLTERGLGWGATGQEGAASSAAGGSVGSLWT